MIESPTILSLSEDPICLDSLLEKVTLPVCGASVFFTGMVREVTFRNEVARTKALFYEAYSEMAVEKMKQVVDEMRDKWPSIVGVAIVQRLGYLVAGTPTTVVGCTAAHRGTGVFEAARYGIDRIKEIVPVWKKEIGLEGEIWIEGHYLMGDADDTKIKD